jgi:alcohol dehydrogenase
VLWQTVEANLRALAAREPGSPALARYGTLGRVLAGSAERLDARAGAALVAWLRDLVRALGQPGLTAHGLADAAIPAVVGASRGSSMRSNPVELTDPEIRGILLAAR